MGKSTGDHLSPGIGSNSSESFGGYSNSPSYAHHTSTWSYSHSSSHPNSSSSGHHNGSKFLRLIPLTVGISISILILAYYIVPRVYKYFYQRKSQKFNEYLRSKEMKAIRKKYFSPDIPSHLLVMNRAIIDDLDTLCVFPLNEHARHLIDIKFFIRFSSVINRSYFRYFFYNIFFRFSRFIKKFYTIKSPFEPVAFTNFIPNDEKEKLLQEWAIAEEKIKLEHQISDINRPASDNVKETILSFDSTEDEADSGDKETKISDDENKTEKKMYFDPKWLENKKFNTRFLSPIDYSCTSLYLCFLLRDFLLSNAIFSSSSEKFIVCLVSPLVIEFRVYEYHAQEFNLDRDIIFNFFSANGLEVLSYVLEKLTTQTNGSELNILLKNMDNTGFIPKMTSKKDMSMSPKID